MANCPVHELRWTQVPYDHPATIVRNNQRAEAGGLAWSQVVGVKSTESAARSRRLAFQRATRATPSSSSLPPSQCRLLPIPTFTSPSNPEIYSYHNELGTCQYVCVKRRDCGVRVRLQYENVAQWYLTLPSLVSSYREECSKAMEKGNLDPITSGDHRVFGKYSVITSGGSIGPSRRRVPKAFPKYKFTPISTEGMVRLPQLHNTALNITDERYA